MAAIPRVASSVKAATTVIACFGRKIGCDRSETTTAIPQLRMEKPTAVATIRRLRHQAPSPQCGAAGGSRARSAPAG